MATKDTDMSYKYELEAVKVVAIVRTTVEENLVILSTECIADPNYKVGLFLEIHRIPKKRRDQAWHHSEVLYYLILNEQIYMLSESMADSAYQFELLEEVEPQVESIIERITI